MTFVLTAEPQVVARETVTGGRQTWAWLIAEDEAALLRAMVRDGTAGSCQRRDGYGDFELLAWDVRAQRAAATLVPKPQNAAAAGTPRRIYLPPATPRGRRTYAPYCYDPARWLD